MTGVQTCALPICYTELADKYDTAFTQNDTGLQQQPDAMAAQQSMAQQTGPEGTANPSPAVNPAMQESLGWLRKLSGLK